METDKTTRRRPDEVHERLLQSAEQVFLRKGFSRATVTEISAEADVALSVLYRHFGSKADLLREALLSPFLAFLDEWMKGIASNQPPPSVEVLRNLIAMIFNSLSAHPVALSLLMASDTLYTPDVRADIHRKLGDVLNALSDLAESEVKRTNLAGAEIIGLHTRLTFAMTLGVLVWQPWLLGADGEPERREQLIDNMAEMIWYGARSRLEPAEQR